MATKTTSKRPTSIAQPNGKTALRKEDIYEMDLNGERVTVAQMMLPLASLIIDNRYQHALSESRAARYAASWSDALAGLVTVSERKKDGTYAILDGQHRSRAKQIRGDEVVWAEVFFDLTLEQEAFIFWQRNKERVPINSLDAFHSALTAKDPEAIRLQTALDKAGVYVGDQESNRDAYRSVAGLVTLLRWGPERTATILLETLRLTRTAWPTEPRVKQKTLLLGLGSLLWNYQGDVDSKRLLKAMQKLTLPKLLMDAGTLKATLGRREWEHAAQLLVKAYNAEDRSGRLDEKSLRPPGKGNPGGGDRG